MSLICESWRMTKINCLLWKIQVAVAVILFGNNPYIYRFLARWHIALFGECFSLFLSVPCPISVTWTLFVCHILRGWKNSYAWCLAYALCFCFSNCTSKLTITGSDNGLLPGRRQAIIRTNAGILLIWALGTNFNEIWSEIHTVSFKKMHLKMSSAKWWPFVPCFRVDCTCCSKSHTNNLSIRFPQLSSFTSLSITICSVFSVRSTFGSYNTHFTRATPSNLTQINELSW